MSNFFQDDGVLWPTLEVIDKVLTIGFPLNDQKALERISKDFAQFSHNRMDKCIIAIDGIFISTRMPSFPNEVANNACFASRDGTGIKVLAGCDAHCKFLFWSSKSPASTHNCIAWEYSKLYNDVFAFFYKISAGYYAIGDEA